MKQEIRTKLGYIDVIFFLERQQCHADIKPIFLRGRGRHHLNNEDKHGLGKEESMEIPLSIMMAKVMLQFSVCIFLPAVDVNGSL